MTEGHSQAASIDPELEALPEPRRPWRRTTLGVMVVTAVLSLWMAWSLRAPARFAAWLGPPRELGALTHVQSDSSLENAWVHGTGALGPTSVEYSRPLDHDRYRVAPLEDDARVWVELRIPEEIEPEHYVAPNSFVGRFVPLDAAGLRHGALASAIASALGKPPPSDAWVLVDGEAPATTRWAVGLVALFLAFAVFNVWGVIRLASNAKAH